MDVVNQPVANGQVGIFAADEQPALVLFYLDRTEVCLRYRYAFPHLQHGAIAGWRVLDTCGRPVEQMAGDSAAILQERGYYPDRTDALRALLALIQERLGTISARRTLVEKELSSAEATSYWVPQVR